MLNTSSYFEEKEPPGDTALSPDTLIFTQTNQSLHLGDLWFQPSSSSSRLLTQGRGILATEQAPFPTLPSPGAKTLPLWSPGGKPGMGTGPCLQNLAVMETRPLLRHGNTTQIVTCNVLSPHSHL